MPILRAFLVHMKGGKLDRRIYAIGNTEVTAGGWVRSRDVCDRNDVHFSASDSDYNSRDTECWTLNQVSMTLGNNPLPMFRSFYDQTAYKRRPVTALVLRSFLVKGSSYLDAS